MSMTSYGYHSGPRNGVTITKPEAASLLRDSKALVAAGIKRGLLSSPMPKVGARAIVYIAWVES